MVHLTRIYTRTGDKGETRLSDNSLARKTDLRVQAYGAVDEANSAVGVVLASGDMPAEVTEVLHVIQHELFDLGADLSTPLVADPEWEPLRILQSSVDRLERWCDEFGDPLPNLRSFILPGGPTVGAAQLHVARTTVRRAERIAWQAAEQYGLDETGTKEQPGGISSVAITYLNRLSDLLFILGRFVTTHGGTQEDAETLWVPGGQRPMTS
ncbi:cob(I)yrinic acid a,c-diamide adenosyltransferase [Aestuariimicrobium sp. p3-SID1156]|uniref:cob(I)yrinic acid a,c-diamide adenosyltransferase n=1 Tax=Aestuariimicrobium sp. p3-SID1156 TaxID=2916038 RepID=UPI00223BE19D|nr:cob(I)yrinic acid a,c-diamide adenosyltransferase [Aestuariimicrobium sp. p3-SID1156]MCT1459450.1 cob(I)yrinic acid a,c-diamide adenosyltransferase [Aestuariimicrobium sp. p3-SID1156]